MLQRYILAIFLFTIASEGQALDVSEPGNFRFGDWEFQYKTDQFQSMCYLVTETTERPDDDSRKRDPLILRLSMTAQGAPFGIGFSPFEDWYTRREAYVLFANGKQKMNSGLTHVSPGTFVAEFVAGMIETIPKEQFEMQFQSRTGDVEASYTFSFVGFAEANEALLAVCGTDKAWEAPLLTRKHPPQTPMVKVAIR